MGSLCPGGRKSMSPFPRRASAPFWSRIVRLSTFESTRKVCLDQPGDHVYRWPLRGQNQMDADGPRLLGQSGERRFHFTLYRHHQVGQLVDDDDNEREYSFGVFLFFWWLRRRIRRLRIDGDEARLGAHRIPERLAFFHLAVEVGHVASSVD